MDTVIQYNPNNVIDIKHVFNEHFADYNSVIPESPRWLLQRGKVEEAHNIVDKIAKKNNKVTPGKDLLMMIAEQSRKEEAKEKMYTYIDLFRTREYTKRTLVMMCFW